MTDKSRMRSSSHSVHVTCSTPLSFGINVILASSQPSRAGTTTMTSATACSSHLSYGSALTAAAIAAAERAYITSAAAVAAAFHHAPLSSSSSSPAAVAAASLWAAATAAAQRHTFIPGVLTSSSDNVTSTDHASSADTPMPPAAIFPWMQERKDRLSGGYIIIWPHCMLSVAAVHRCGGPIATLVEVVAWSVTVCRTNTHIQTESVDSMFVCVYWSRP